MFCANCGAEVLGAGAAAAEAGEMTDATARVEIVRLETKRDIEVARITAGTVRELADVETAAELAHAEGEVDGMEAVLDTMAGDPPAADGPPIVVDAPADPPSADPVDMLPPVVDPPTDPADSGESKSAGFWGAYS